ncbi:Methyltransferase [Planococcus halocryophilus Or1]|uniref:Methyltransferase n=1 Tax=Planococcus halocryophilus TaxID=1215089 RepID=A0A1C7DUU1_9BACL|nr:class I SAM-dependent methyltransferase [Planococcus halocryophilus]ANU15184.1 methyltransferase [Planococcus halocryophilus]EMF47016.1 Methyltransferase [Planococcus halocryophilus Or1]
MLGYYSKLSSEVYDLDKPIGSSFGDIEYYLERLGSCKGRILEPATGTGRLLVPLLEKGFEVDGFDVSEEMLTVCRANCEKHGFRPNLFHAKMESFSVDRTYAAIVIPTGTFLLLDEREKSLRALQNFYNHLEIGGRLIVDLDVPAGVELEKTSTRTWQALNGDTLTVESKKIKVDWIHQTFVSQGRYECWREGKLIETELERYPMRWYGVEEFRTILENIGFKEIVISSGYQIDHYPKNANSIITYEATK